MPILENVQFTRRNYTFTVLLEPEQPRNSHQLDLALSLLRMNYPEEQAKYFHQLLYSGDSLEAYSNRIIAEQRDSYRSRLSPEAADVKTRNWRYAETIDVNSSENWGLVVERMQSTENDLVKKPQNLGIIVKRVVEVYNGELLRKSTRYHVLDMDDLKQVRIDDLFTNFQNERRLRDIVYEELRIYADLERGQSLSEGMYFSDEPELSFNFYFTEEGLGLHWDASQIAPHANGDIEIVLLWQVIRPLLLTSGLELLTKFNIHLFM